ncbi:hypothetical protein DFA_06869 [Cavenderia fasciculata]|uniref:40S ribosomal protein S29 n=1 Tax=Cavenderia fasciculata TaxID=261658 RepID=F4PWW6_CACFS|nr:uncharacterized protein DFA_06869 [Cavenderia fasciculata]EGG19769.1 hypothetical protein DFA_06869 [Cavenderia fasciculata]|eukprot:XP_004358115.1 hypothetical protein DFA_06869 [Cavenderia fasciculata]
MARELWLTHPGNYGPGSRQCRKCGNHHGLIRKYGLNMCRRCFRESANAIGFHKLSSLSSNQSISTTTLEELHQSIYSTFNKYWDKQLNDQATTWISISVWVYYKSRQALFEGDDQSVIYHVKKFVSTSNSFKDLQGKALDTFEIILKQQEKDVPLNDSTMCSKIVSSGKLVVRLSDPAASEDSQQDVNQFVWVTYQGEQKRVMVNDDEDFILTVLKSFHVPESLLRASSLVQDEKGNTYTAKNSSEDTNRVLSTQNIQNDINVMEGRNLSTLDTIKWYPLVPIKPDDKVTGDLRLKIRFDKEKAEKDKNPFIKAIKDHDLVAFEHLLAKPKIDINVCDTEGVPATHLIAVFKYNIKRYSRKYTITFICTN